MIDPDIQQYIDAVVEQAIQNQTPMFNEVHNRSTRVYRETATALALSGAGIQDMSWDTLIGVDELSAWRPDIPTQLTVPRSGWFTITGGFWVTTTAGWGAVQADMTLRATPITAVAAEDYVALHNSDNLMPNGTAFNSTLSTGPIPLLGGSRVIMRLIGPAAATFTYQGRTAGVGYASFLSMTELTNPLNYQEALV